MRPDAIIISTKPKPVAETADTVRTMIHRGTLSRQFATGAGDMRTLLEEGKVTMVFQPIVGVPSRMRTVRSLLVLLARFAGGIGEVVVVTAEEMIDIVAQDGPEAAAEAKPIDDLRGSEAFRRELVEVLTVRALEVCVERAGGGRA